MGALVAAGLLAPLVLDRPDDRHRILGSAPMVTLGRWSYGMFVWHLAALAMVFPVIGEFPFHGHMPEVLALTLVFGYRDRRGELCARRIAVPGCVAALGDTQETPAGRQPSAARQEDAVAP